MKYFDKDMNIIRRPKSKKRRIKDKFNKRVWVVSCYGVVCGVDTSNLKIGDHIFKNV